MWAQMLVGACGSLWKFPLIISIFSKKQEARSMAEMRLAEDVLENRGRKERWYEFVASENGRMNGLDKCSINVRDFL